MNSATRKRVGRFTNIRATVSFTKRTVFSGISQLDSKASRVKFFHSQGEQYEQIYSAHNIGAVFCMHTF